MHVVFQFDAVLWVPADFFVRRTVFNGNQMILALPFRMLLTILFLNSGGLWPGDLWLNNAVCGAEQTESLEYFERQVRPLLNAHCQECHSSTTGQDNGALILDTVAGIATGGTRGRLVHPEDVDRSLLLRAVRYADTDLQMPPKGKLADADLEILEKWVRDGAVLPEYKEAPRPATHAIDFRKGREFWSFQPLRSVDVPSADTEWCTSVVDNFILHQMKQNGLYPSPEADAATLLRRLSFDVTGLPPSVDELNAFLSNAAWEQAVDRLLSSPQMGERWARIWLDLARYTDFTPEWQSPTDRGWIYRDWVVKSINDNVPYDQFVKLQLAADLLPDTAPEDLAALGFLGLSPTYWKELRLAPSVIEQIVADEWDERIDAVSRTFLGLTVSCARCHDHKFDPVSTEDYYALAGVFASTQLDERPLLPAPEAQKVRDARARVQTLEAELKVLKEKKSEDAQRVEQEIAGIRANTPGFDTPFAHVLREASIYVKADGDELTKLEYEEARPRDLPVFRRGNPANAGDIVARRFLTVFQQDAPAVFQDGSGRRELAEAMLNQSGGLLARVIVNRIWEQHFGSGLVRTPSDFGLQGDRPTHPDLLEYLSYQLVEHGWDLRWLHRTILLSAAYRQSSAWREDGFAADPDNRLLWRMNRRRLDIEMWRDATLAVTGQLDLRPGGPSRPIDDPENVRRTLYVTVAREELHPVLRMHDFPEASAHSPRREPTTTPLQQLFVLNSAWMEKQAAALSNRIRELENDHSRIEMCYLLMFSRSPSQQEYDLAQKFLNQTTAGEPHAGAPAVAGDPAVESVSDQSAASTAARDVRWKLYLQSLLGLNEFHFVD